MYSEKIKGLVIALGDDEKTVLEIARRVEMGTPVVNSYLKRYPELFERSRRQRGLRQMVQLWRCTDDARVTVGLDDSAGCDVYNSEIDECVEMLRNMSDHDLETVAYMLARNDAPLVDRFVNIMIDSIGGNDDLE